MTQTASYVEYLQSLLTSNQIDFIPQHEFQKQSSKDMKKQQIKQKPLETNLKHPLTAKLIQRYSRQMLLPQIGYSGQLKLVEAKVAIIGAGGIGCPLALYLAGAGIGTIAIYDSDTVDLTNLHRQIGHRTSTIGKSKTQSLASAIYNLNPQIKVIAHPFINPSNVGSLEFYDLVIDGSDNPQCRYIVNDYCMQKSRKLLSGACIGWQAQVTCYGEENACYRCIWGNEQVSFGGCSSLGVIGMLPGFVGIMLAIEALKIITGDVSSLSGYLLTFEAKKCQFKKLKLRKKVEGCVACGKDKLDIATFDYSKYGNCRVGQDPPEVPVKTWPEYLATNSKDLILDVRPSAHYRIARLNNSYNIPLEDLYKLKKEDILQEYWTEQSLIPVSCVRGISSRHAVKYLLGLGLKAYSIDGGILKYKYLYDEDIPQL